MSIWKMEVTLEKLKQLNQNTMGSYLGIEFIEIGENYLKASMPVEQRIKQPFGIMHGGASCVLAETVASVAANFCVDTNIEYCVGLDINTNHIRSIRDGLVIAKAEPFHIGRNTHVWSIDIRDENHKLISINRLTVAVLQR